MPTVIIPLVDGVEEMEFVILMDVLRRAGWNVTALGMHQGPVSGSRGVRFLPDKEWGAIDLSNYDMLVLPGGAEGSRRLMENQGVLEAIRCFVGAERWVGAICAAPLVLQAAGVLSGRRITCHPSVADRITHAKRLPDRVVVDGRIVTSQGPGTTFEFALTMIRLVSGTAAAEQVEKNLIL